jgi:hypothetical protein
MTRTLRRIRRVLKNTLGDAKKKYIFLLSFSCIEKAPREWGFALGNIVGALGSMLKDINFLII